MAINLLKNYTKKDFTNALKKLLPPGLYWHSTDKEEVINLLLDALGQELKTTHDETQLNLLNQLDKTQQGWKLSDYEAQLQLLNKQATVYDDSANPNVIFVEFDKNQLVGEVIKKLENYRLPHTAFNFKNNRKHGLHVASTYTQLKVNRTAKSFNLKRSTAGKVFATMARATIRINRTKMIAGY